MKIHDLGLRDGPLLLFGGPYSNFQATQAILDEAARRGIAHENCICTGDVVAYCGRPADTVDLIRSAGLPVVAGNCEKQLAAGAMDCGCGFAAGSTCDLLSAGWFAHADAHVDGAARSWMAECPDLMTFTHAGGRYAVIHGGVTDISRFLWPVSPERELEEEIKVIDTALGPVDGVISGHCGMAFTRRVGSVHWVNAGAIGLPAHDGLTQTSFATLTDGVVELHRLNYDVPAAHADMVAAGLTQGYHETLLTGYWPSEDVLPPDLRRAALARG